MPNKYLISITIFIYFITSCVTNKTQVLTSTKISTNIGIGANFFNDEEDYERILAAKKMGIKWIRLTPSKWKSSLYPHKKGSFLIGNFEKYTGLIENDIKILMKVLDWAHELDMKVALTFLSVPGRIFTQHNNYKLDNRLWESDEYQEQALSFFKDVSLHISHHPALLALNPINEPSPEKAKVRFYDWLKDDYAAWGQKIANTTQDLNNFYAKVVKNIRKFNKHLPIILDSGFHAHPHAFKVLKPINDNNVWYSFHWYEPFVYSQNKLDYTYPGYAPTGENPQKEDTVYWDKNTLEKFLQPVIDWQKQYNIPANKIVVGEFGVNRLMQGAKDYLFDVRNLFVKYGFMHAFYAFREPHFPRMDYELGASKNIGSYWLSLENKVSPNYEKLRKPELIDALGIGILK